MAQCVSVRVSVAGWTELQQHRQHHQQQQQHHPPGEVRSARRAAHRYLAAILHGFSTLEFEKCPGLPGTGPWTFSAPVRPEQYLQRCDSRGPVELRAR